MARRYFVDQLPEPGTATLDGDVARHLATVLRVRAGDELVLADGRGSQCPATIRRLDKQCIEVTVQPPSHTRAPLQLLHIAFAPPRFARAEWLFEHGTEVGVAVFHPLWTERTRPQGERQDRWHKVLRAAAGQCDRAWLPLLRPLRSLAEFLADPELPALRWFGKAHHPVPTMPVPGEALLLVGPEGGFSAAESERIAAAGFRPAGLGAHVLRTETAALVGAALLLAGAATPAAGTPLRQS